MRIDRKNELYRKLIHIGSLIIPFSYRYVFSYNRWLMFVILLTSLIILIAIELSRMEMPSFRKVFHKYFGLTLRYHERRDLTGATFLVFSSLLCVVILKPVIAFLAISYLSIGDTFAAIVGLSYGKRRFNNQHKSMEGSLGCFASILSFSFIFGNELNPWVYVTGCFAATLAEIWKLDVDDNIKIPVISGLTMSFVNLFF